MFARSNVDLAESRGRFDEAVEILIKACQQRSAAGQGPGEGARARHRPTTDDTSQNGRARLPRRNPSSPKPGRVGHRLVEQRAFERHRMDTERMNTAAGAHPAFSVLARC